MKRYSISVVLHILLLVVLSIGGYLLFCYELWFSTLIVGILLIATGVHLYSIQMKLAGMMRRLTDCIRFNDMTQNFQPPFKSKMMVELADELSQTLRLFRGRLLEEEIKHQYYENLLNKVDTAVVVTDRSGRVEWMNRAAVALVGQESRLPQEWLTTSWNETQVVRIRQQGASVEMAVSCTLFAAQNKERLLVSLKNIHSVLERNEMEAWQKLIRVLTHEIDNTAVRQEQIENLKRLKEGRNQAEVDKALEAITECVKTGKGNLLELAVEAARVRATLGEISYACEKIVGRYKAVIRTISGVYSSESKNDSDFHRACELAEKFAKKEGRQPRIMVAKMGQDGHDRGAKVVATGYADCGFDVDMGPLFQTPAEAAREAVENDVHVVGVSSLAAGHKTLVPQIIEELKKLGREDIVVIAGGVIPAQDYDFLYKAGVAAIFGPGTPVAKAACQILEILLDEE